MKYLGQKSTWLQILFWSTLWGLMQFLIFGSVKIERTTFMAINVMLAVSVIVFVNLEVLLPKLYFKKKIPFYILSSIILVLLIYSLMEIPFWMEKGLPFSKPYKPRSHNRIIIMRYMTKFLPMIISLIGSSLFAIAGFAASKEKEMAQLKSEKLKAEMDFLKSQTNPHFLFNALNNIYTLSVIKSDRTPENLLKLSDMLRYMLYDCKADRVPLKKELEYIDNFVALNQLKDSQGLNIKIKLDRSQPNLMVAPLIFIPFIENAFKHSKIEDLEKGWIEIELNIIDTVIHFNVRNSIPEKAYTKDTIGGIGLKNVKRQLELIYPEKHSLDIVRKDAVFEIILKIHP